MLRLDTAKMQFFNLQRVVFIDPNRSGRLIYSSPSLDKCLVSVVVKSADVACMRSGVPLHGGIVDVTLISFLPRIFGLHTNYSSFHLPVRHFYKKRRRDIHGRPFRCCRWYALFTPHTLIVRRRVIRPPKHLMSTNDNSCFDIFIDEELVHPPDVEDEESHTAEELRLETQRISAQSRANRERNVSTGLSSNEEVRGYVIDDSHVVFNVRALLSEAFTLLCGLPDKMRRMMTNPKPAQPSIVFEYAAVKAT